MSHFSSLPNETVLKIFSYLNPSDLSNVSQVCKRFYNLAKDPHLTPAAVHNGEKELVEIEHWITKKDNKIYEKFHGEFLPLCIHRDEYKQPPKGTKEHEEWVSRAKKFKVEAQNMLFELSEKLEKYKKQVAEIRHELTSAESFLKKALSAAHGKHELEEAIKRLLVRLALTMHHLDDLEHFLQREDERFHKELKLFMNVLGEF